MNMGADAQADVLDDDAPARDRARDDVVRGPAKPRPSVGEPASFRSMLAIAVPTALANLAEYVPVGLTLVIVGRSGNSDQLDALALARTYFNVTAFSISYGLISALRTLCPQAVGGGKSEMHGVYAQRALVVTTVGLVPSVVLAFYADRVLVAFGQPPRLARLAREYTSRLIASLLGLNLMTIGQRVLTAENLVGANLAVCGAVALLSPGLVYVLVRAYGWLGAAWAAAAYQMLFVALQLPVFARYHGLAKILFTPRCREAVSAAGLAEYLKLAAPGLVFTILEWWTTELILIVGGTRTSARTIVGALAIASTFQMIGSLTWLGLMVACSVRVGHAVGAGDARSAEAYAWLGLRIAAAAGAAGAAALYFGRRVIAALFVTHDAGIRRLFVDVAPALAVFVFFDAINAVVQGALAGAGIPRTIAVANFGAWYVVGAPLGLGLVFGLDLDEAAASVLLLSAAAALCTSFCIQIVVVARHDWDRSIADARSRLLLASSSSSSSSVEEEDGAEAPYRLLADHHPARTDDDDGVRA